MKKKIALLLVGLLIINLLGVSAAWAKEGEKVKNLPPGLAKKIQGVCSLTEEEIKKLPPGIAKKIKNFSLEDLEEIEDLPPGIAKKFREVLPKGLAKDGKELPPPFRVMQLWQCELEGEIVYITTLGDYQWVVIKGEDCLRTGYLDAENKGEYAVGDLVKAKLMFNRIIEMELIDEISDDKDDKVENLTYTLQVTPNRVKAGEKVDFQLQVANKTGKDITKQFASGQRYDFIVKKDGKKVWQWSDDYSFIQVIQNVNIKDGQTLYYTESWKPEEVGLYTVEAYFMGESTEEPVAVKRFRVVEADSTK